MCLMVSLGIAIPDRRPISGPLLCNFPVSDPTRTMLTATAKEQIRMNSAPASLLATDEPPPFTITNEDGQSPFLIVCDHAGKHLPRALQKLGLQEAECERHIAWDIGAGAVACRLGDALDAMVI